MTARARICLIDDDVVVLDAMALGLRDTGYEVLTAPGAAAGLAAREGVDVIVTDLNMPGTGGAQLIAEVRSNWPAMPIIAISGATTIDGRSVGDVARDLGADSLLAKPFRAHQLKDLIDQALAARLGQRFASRYASLLSTSLVVGGAVGLDDAEAVVLVDPIERIGESRFGCWGEPLRLG